MLHHCYIYVVNSTYYLCVTNKVIAKKSGGYANVSLDIPSRLICGSYFDAKRHSETAKITCLGMVILNFN